MSTFAYAALTNIHEDTRKTRQPSGIKGYIDAMAALVPAEILTLHALMLSATTEIIQNENSTPITKITDPVTLEYAFWGLVVLSVVIFVATRFKRWTSLDYLRMLIPPAAFVVWTMLQRTTAFDVIGADLAEAPRTVIALFAAAILGLIAGSLAMKAEKSDSG